MEQKLREWMQHVLDTGGIERFDNLHIDEIDVAWADPAQWVHGIEKVLPFARIVQAEVAPDKVLALLCSLEDGPKEPPTNTGELAAQFDWSPPSLYLFQLDGEPWSQADFPGRLRSISTEHFTSFNAASMFLQEWQHEGTLRRSFVVV